MLADGTLERYDMRFAQSFRNLDLSQPVGTSFNGSGRQKRIAGADIPQAMAFIAESLLDWQGVHIPKRGNEFRVEFPLAVDLHKGDKYHNIDNGLIYTVDYVFKHRDSGKPTGEVILTGEQAPKTWHRLRPEDGVVFMHSYPKTLAQPYDLDSESNQVQESGTWRDTITWLVVRREPGTLQKSPFEGTREAKPRHREYVHIESTNCDYAQDIRGQLFDNIVQFDLWAQTNRRAEAMVQWFHDFIDQYTWVWKINGVKEVLYWQQTSDSLVTRWRKDIVNRSVQVYFQTERHSGAPIRRLRDIEIAIDVLVRGEELVDPTQPIDPTGCVDPTGQIPITIIEGVGSLYD